MSAYFDKLKEILDYLRELRDIPIPQEVTIQENLSSLLQDESEDQEEPEEAPQERPTDILKKQAKNLAPQAFTPEKQVRSKQGLIDSLRQILDQNDENIKEVRDRLNETISYLSSRNEGEVPDDPDDTADDDLADRIYDLERHTNRLYHITGVNGISVIYNGEDGICISGAGEQRAGGAGGTEGATFPVLVTKDGGVSGGAAAECTWTYEVRALDDTTVLAEDVTPEQARLHYVGYIYAGEDQGDSLGVTSRYAIAAYDATNTLRLLYVPGEIADYNVCP